MAAFFGLFSSRGLLLFQLAIFIWQALRPAATLRIPWALFTTAVYKIFRGKKFHDEYFILLCTDYNDTADPYKFCEENKGIVFEKPLDNSVEFRYKNSRYICSADKASQIRLLIIGEVRNVPIVKEHKVVNGFMGVWTLCSADEAIRMCLPSKRFTLSFRKTVSFCLIEHMPLKTNTCWLPKVLCGMPLYLTAKGNERLSSILTLVLIILDFTYNIWVPALQKAYIMFVRCVQLLLSNLSVNLRFLIFYLLSNFDNKYLPCSISDFKVKIKRTGVFYTTDNTVLNCPVESITKLSIDKVDILQKNVYEFQASAFKVHITITSPSKSPMVGFELWLLDVLYDLVKATYTMTQHNFKTYIRCWELLEEGNIGLVQTVDHGLIIKNMHLFGFEETINLFWGSNVNVYEVRVRGEYSYLIAGKNEKCVNFPALDSPVWGTVLKSGARRFLDSGIMRHSDSSVADKG